MAAHNDLGKNGEELAVKHLTAQGYRIVARNWKCQKLELDIVAEKDGEIVIVEVKTRKNDLFARPQDAVTERKIKNTVRAADRFINDNSIDLPARFDIITVTGEGPDAVIDHLEDAFSPPLM